MDLYLSFMFVFIFCLDFWLDISILYLYFVSGYFFLDIEKV